MKILFTSDLHGHIGAITRFTEILSSNEYDIGIISGDIMTYNPDINKAELDIKNILHKSNKKIFFIMGNDDGILDHNWSNTEYLENPNLKKINYQEYNFVGYQYTNPYVGGPFEKSEKEQEKDIDLLKSLIDSKTIFITHGPQYGILDLTYDKKHVGSKALKRLLEERKPKLHLFGHIHQSAGIYKYSINGAYPNIKKFVRIDLNENKVRYVR